MLNGFDTETAPLNDKEKDLLPLLEAELKRHYGKDQAITNKGLQAAFPELSDSRVRKVINYIRNNASVPCLVASNAGYYIAETEAELLAYEESLRGREMAIRQVRTRIEEQRLYRFRGCQDWRLF